MRQITVLISDKPMEINNAFLFVGSAIAKMYSSVKWLDLSVNA